MRGWLIGLDLALCVLLGIMLGMAPAGWLATRTSSEQVDAASSLRIPPTAEREPVVLHSTPMFSADGVLAELFPDGQGLADSHRIRLAIDRQAEALGMRSYLPALWAEIQDGDEEADPADYPYAFPTLDALLSDALPRSVIVANPDQVNDLAASFIFAAGLHNNADSGLGGQAGRVAYSLLNRLREVRPSCAVQLNLAFVISSDPIARDDDVAAEFAKAGRQCGDDLTAQWRLGHFRIGRTYVNDPGLYSWVRDLSRQQHTDRALETFTQLQAEHPGSPLGWMGEADLWAKLADERTALGVEPFTARRLYRQALALYQRASTLTDDPFPRAGQARALVGLGETGKAGEAAAQALALEPDHVTLQSITLAALDASHEYAAAADLAGTSQVTMPGGLSLIGEWFSGYDHDLLPTTLGLDDAVPVRINLTNFSPEGGGLVTDYEFLPAARPFDTVSPWCRVGFRWRALILAGSPGEALREMNGEVTGAGPFPLDYYCTDPVELVIPSEPDSPDGVLAAVAALEADDAQERARWIPRPERLEEWEFDPLSMAHERRQNMWRSAGNLDLAERAARQWITELPDDPYAYDRLGEIAFNQRRYSEAADAFAEAVELFNAAGDDFAGDEITERQGGPNDGAAAVLKYGAALEAAGHPDQAAEQYRRAEQLGRAQLKASDDPDFWATRVRFYALSQLGYLALSHQRFDEAVSHYEQARSVGEDLEFIPRPLPDGTEEPQPDRTQKGVVENNLALALIAADRAGDAAPIAAAGLAKDPSNPIFIETAAFAQAARGQPERAIDTYDAALAEDPTLFSAASNRGVLLADQGRLDRAIDSFRTAVAANPEFATGWSNLGRALRDAHPVSAFVEAQGAFGRAANLNHDLRGSQPELTFDNALYDTGLDLSRPIPPNWTFTQTARPSVTPLTALAILVILTNLIRTLVLEETGSRTGQILLRDRSTEPRRGWWSGMSLSVPVGWGAVITTALLAASLLDRLRAPTAYELVVIGAGLAMVAIYLRCRHLAAAPNESIEHRTWAPSLAFSGLAALVGVAFLPLPHLHAPATADGRVRWSGPHALIVITTLLFLGAVITGNPVSRTLAVVGTAMIASILLPISPLDGGYVRSRWAARVIASLLALATALVALNWV